LLGAGESKVADALSSWRCDPWPYFLVAKWLRRDGVKWLESGF
jgi:hypothetical protein